MRLVGNQHLEHTTTIANVKHLTFSIEEGLSIPKFTFAIVANECTLLISASISSHISFRVSNSEQGWARPQLVFFFFTRPLRPSRRARCTHRSQSIPAANPNPIFFLLPPSPYFSFHRCISTWFRVSSETLAPTCHSTHTAFTHLPPLNLNCASTHVSPWMLDSIFTVSAVFVLQKSYVVNEQPQVHRLSNQKHKNPTMPRYRNT